MDYSPPGSFVHGIPQARILEWVVMPSSRGYSWPRDWTQVSCITGRFFTSEPVDPENYISVLGSIIKFPKKHLWNTWVFILWIVSNKDSELFSRQWKNELFQIILIILDIQIVILDKVIRMTPFQMWAFPGTSFLKVLFPQNMCKWVIVLSFSGHSGKG